jgi:hypothetical protein
MTMQPRDPLPVTFSKVTSKSSSNSNSNYNSNSNSTTSFNSTTATRETGTSSTASNGLLVSLVPGPKPPTTAAISDGQYENTPLSHHPNSRNTKNNGNLSHPEIKANAHPSCQTEGKPVDPALGGAQRPNDIHALANHKPPLTGRGYPEGSEGHKASPPYHHEGPQLTPTSEPHNKFGPLPNKVLERHSKLEGSIPSQDTSKGGPASIPVSSRVQETQKSHQLIQKHLNETSPNQSNNVSGSQSSSNASKHGTVTHSKSSSKPTHSLNNSGNPGSDPRHLQYSGGRWNSPKVISSVAAAFSKEYHPLPSVTSLGSRLGKGVNLSQLPSSENVSGVIELLSSLEYLGPSLSHSGPHSKRTGPSEEHSVKSLSRHGSKADLLNRKHPIVKPNEKPSGFPLESSIPLTVPLSSLVPGSFLLQVTLGEKRFPEYDIRPGLSVKSEIRSNILAEIHKKLFSTIHGESTGYISEVEKAILPTITGPSSNPSRSKKELRYAWV